MLQWWYKQSRNQVELEVEIAFLDEATIVVAVGVVAMVAVVAVVAAVVIA